MKYLVITAVIVGAAALWWNGRKRAVQDQIRRDIAARLPTALERCPRCGVHAPTGTHSCG